MFLKKKEREELTIEIMQKIDKLYFSSLLRLSSAKARRVVKINQLIIYHNESENLFFYIITTKLNSFMRSLY